MGVTTPEKPALQLHPLTTLTPLLFEGQNTGVQVELKKGEPTRCDTDPENPGLQEQPEGTLAPVLLAGQGTAEQVDTKKGDVLVGLTTPL